MTDRQTSQAVVLWVDPGCPWAWKTARWLRELRDQGLVSIEWRLFSLEVNTAGLGVPFQEAADRYGESLMALTLARREGGDGALESYYEALASMLHDDGETISPKIARRAADASGMPGLVERAVAERTLADEILREYREARELDVFGVPSLQLGRAPAIYGPIMPDAPTGEAAREWWDHVSWLIGRDMYELKRWPRGRKPGTS